MQDKLKAIISILLGKPTAYGAQVKYEKEGHLSLVEPLNGFDMRFFQ